MSKIAFLKQPEETTYCIVSIGPPGAGKSWVFLHTLEQWINYGMFDEYHLILPAYKYEKSGSYDFLKPHEKKKGSKVHIYDAYSKMIVKDLIKQGEKEETSKEKKKRIFFAIDDSTVESGDLMKSKEMVQLAVMCRHYNIHTWLIMHCAKGIIPPKVRNQIKYVFLYSIPPPLLENVYKEYVDDVDFKKFKIFEEYWYANVEPLDHGCLLLDKVNKEYSIFVNQWYKK